MLGRGARASRPPVRVVILHLITRKAEAGMAPSLRSVPCLPRPLRHDAKTYPRTGALLARAVPTWSHNPQVHLHDLLEVQPDAQDAAGSFPDGLRHSRRQNEQHPEAHEQGQPVRAIELRRPPALLRSDLRASRPLGRSPSGPHGHSCGLHGQPSDRQPDVLQDAREVRRDGRPAGLQDHRTRRHHGRRGKSR